MSFPVYSTAVITKQIARAVRVLRRARIAEEISYAGVFNCRKIAGSDRWSQHSWGHAVDLFPKASDEHADEACARIAAAVVRQATRRTIANRGRPLAVAEVIDHANMRIWTPSRGWHAYTGTRGPHVHVSGSPLRTGTPPCAG
jgi:hypothetical protein